MFKQKHLLVDNRAIDMTPMIDVVFQLILFFMLTSSLQRPNQIELDLPESSSGAKSQDQPSLVISYGMLEGKPAIRLNDQAVEGLDKLASAMKAGADPKQKPRVDIRIEKDVPYQDVVSVLDTVRDAGFPKFSLLTHSRRAGK